MRRIALFVATLALAGCAGTGGPKEVNVTVTENGFEPASVEVAKGSTTTLIITRKFEATCASSAIFAETGRKYDLPLNEAVRIEIPTESAMTLHYACSMDMYKGEVVIK